MIDNRVVKSSSGVRGARRALGWNAAGLCLLVLPLACGSYEGVGGDEAGSEEIVEGEELGTLEQAIGGGTLVTTQENVVNQFGPAVRMLAGGGCSGVKIGDRKFLTAAHCFSDTRTSIQITNSLDGVFPSTNFTITKQLQHPSHKIGFDGGELVENGLYDLKVIEIAELTPSIPVAKVTPLAAAVGTTGFISVGYGCDTQNPNNSNKKQKGEFNAVQGNSTAHVHYISENRSRTICEGDSGGPLFRLVNGEMQVTGINAGTAVFTRIENTVQWVSNPVVNVFTNNSPGYFMNMAAPSTSAKPVLNCAGTNGNGGQATLDVRLEQCDGLAALYNGGKSVNWAPIAGNTAAGFQKIIASSNGHCLSVDGASTADANVSAAPCAASNAALATRQSQAWRFVDVGSAAPASVGTAAIRMFNIVNERSGKCLSTTGSSADAVTSDVRQSTCNSTRLDQKWVFTR